MKRGVSNRWDLNAEKNHIIQNEGTKRLVCSLLLQNLSLIGCTNVLWLLHYIRKVLSVVNMVKQQVHIDLNAVQIVAVFFDIWRDNYVLIHNFWCTTELPVGIALIWRLVLDAQWIPGRSRTTRYFGGEVEWVEFCFASIGIFFFAAARAIFSRFRRLQTRGLFERLSCWRL